MKAYYSIKMVIHVCTCTCLVGLSTLLQFRLHYCVCMAVDQWIHTYMHCRYFKLTLYMYMYKNYFVSLHAWTCMPWIYVGLQCSCALHYDTLMYIVHCPRCWTHWCIVHSLIQCRLTITRSLTGGVSWSLIWSIQPCCIGLPIHKRSYSMNQYQ